MTINDEEASVVRLIFKLYTEGEDRGDGVIRHPGMNEIARRLDALGIKTPSGGSGWLATTIRRILLNPLYIGKVRWSYQKTKKISVNGTIRSKKYFAPEGEYVLADGLHPAIISDDLFKRAAEIIHQKNTSNSG